MLVNDIKNEVVRLEEEKDKVKVLRMLNQFKDEVDSISTYIYSSLENDDKKVFIQWMLKRWANVNVLPEKQFQDYRDTVKKFKQQPFEDYYIGDNKYKKQDFRPQGGDFDLVTYDWFVGVHDIYFNQYEHKNFKVDEGDVVLDIGAFLGDTAVLFSHKAKHSCKIYSFEFFESSVTLFKENMKINPLVAPNVELIQKAVSDKSAEKLYIHTSNIEGATSVSKDKASDSDIEVETITVDDFVKEKKLEKVDYIKMDIEGAERLALAGAKETIQKFKPKIAICLYHIWDDASVLPKMLYDILPNYKYSFKWVHFSLGWEAVLLAEYSDKGIETELSNNEKSELYSFCLDELKVTELLEKVYNEKVELKKKISKLSKSNEKLEKNVASIKRGVWYQFGQMGKKEKIFFILRLIFKKIFMLPLN